MFQRLGNQVPAVVKDANRSLALEHSERFARELRAAGRAFVEDPRAVGVPLKSTQQLVVRAVEVDALARATVE